MRHSPAALAVLAAFSVLVPVHAAPQSRAVEQETWEPVYLLQVTVRSTAGPAAVRLDEPAVMIEGVALHRARGTRASFGEFGPGPLRVRPRARRDRASATFVVAVTPGGAKSFRFVVRAPRRGTRVPVRN
ncbi:MAG TPA: hypothetical protein VG709_01860, partial [Actinomycetota bacterium]|nr:hypothetical protein [Actinomycetota bacterium]